jgi:hypothetical protein
VATGEDLGIQLELFSDVPPAAADQMLDAFCHTLTLVFVDRELLESSDALFDWLRDCFAHTARSTGRHGMIVLALEERVGVKFVKWPGLEFCQVRPVQEFGEYAIRAAMVALLVLHETRVLLEGAFPRAVGRRRSQRGS